jgi:hypothetical protein
MTAEKRNGYLLVLTTTYLIGLALCQLLLTVPGGRVPFYILLAILTMLPAIHKCLGFRLWAVVATTLTLALIALDHSRGLEFERVKVRIEKAGPHACSSESGYHSQRRGQNRGGQKVSVFAPLCGTQKP